MDWAIFFQIVICYVTLSLVIDTLIRCQASSVTIVTTVVFSVNWCQPRLSIYSNDYRLILI